MSEENVTYLIRAECSGFLEINCFWEI